MAGLDFQKLVDDFYAPLYRFALSLSRRESDAADLAQQTFYLWAAKGHQLRDPTKVKTWLFTTLHREFLGGKRRQDRFVQQDENGPIPEPLTIDPTVVNEMDSAIVHEALLALDERFRAPLSLFYLQQNSYREIAEILDVPIGTVMSRISRGKAELRKALADDATQRRAQLRPVPTGLIDE